MRLNRIIFASGFIVSVIAVLFAFQEVNIGGPQSVQAQVSGVTLHVQDAVTGSPATTCLAGGQTIVRVSVEGPQNLAALSYTLSFDSAVATLAGSALSAQIPAGWLVSENPNVAGEYTVGMIGTTPAGVNGFDIVDLTLDCVGSSGEQTAPTFTAITAGDTDDLEVASTGVSGSLTIAPATILRVNDAGTGSADTTCLAGGQAVVRVSVSNPQNLAALAFTLNFNPAVATLAGSALSAQVPVGWLVSENPNVAGEYTVGMIGTTPAGVDGFDIVDLTLDCVGSSEAQTTLGFAAITAGDTDDNELTSSGVNGSLTIKPGGLVTLHVQDAVTGSLNITCAAGGQALARISAETPQNLAALAFTLNFNPAVATLAGSALSAQVPAGWLVSENPNVAGEYTVGMIGTTPAGVTGFDIVDLTLDCVGSSGDKTDLAFSAITAGDTNDNELTSSVVNGSLEIIGPPPCPTTVELGLQALSTNLVRIWNRNDQTASWTVHDRVVSSLSDLTQLVEGRVYWLKINQAQTLAFCERTQQFFAGWNVFAWAPDDSAATSSAPSAEAFANLIAGDTLTRVWNFNGETQSWAFFDPRPAFASANTLTLIVPDRVYLVTVTIDVSVTLNGKPRELFAGLNFVHW